MANIILKLQSDSQFHFVSDYQKLYYKIVTECNFSLNKFKKVIKFIGNNEKHASQKYQENNFTNM